MSNFIGSDVVDDFHVGDENNLIVKGEVYPVCRFPGSHDLRRLTFSQPVVFEQEAEDIIEFINESGDVVFTVDTGDVDKKISEFVTLEVQPTELSIQSVSVRWVKNGGKVSATFSGNVFVYDASDMVSIG